MPQPQLGYFFPVTPGQGLPGLPPGGPDQGFNPNNPDQGFNPSHPDQGLPGYPVQPGRPIDPGFGNIGGGRPVDPGYGNFPGRPVDPGYGNPMERPEQLPVWPTDEAGQGLPELPPGTIWPPLEIPEQGLPPSPGFPGIKPGWHGKAIVAVAVYGSRRGWRTHYVVIDVPELKPERPERPGQPGQPGQPDQGFNPNNPDQSLPAHPGGRPPTAGQPLPGAPRPQPKA